MSRRRRQRNPLLMRILVISVAAHAVALPVAAHFGVFERVKREFGTSRIVMVTLPPVERERPKPATKTERRTKTAARRTGHSAAPKSTAAKRANVPQPKVVAAGASGDGEGTGPTVDPNGTGTAGQLPTGSGATPPPKPPPAETPTSPPPVPKPDAPTPVERPKEPTPPEPKKEPIPTAPAAPVARKIVQAEAWEAPEPTIPDDLRGEPFEKTLIVEADIDAAGLPKDVRVATSTGIRALDDAGLDAARRYRFRPATIDGVPTEQHVRFRIVFRVS